MDKVKVMQDYLAILNIVGVPSVCAMVVWCIRKMSQFSKNIKILMDAQQKQMRRDLLIDYHRYKDQNFITDEDLDAWEAAYQAYHSLGANGVMDARREELMDLSSKVGDRYDVD